MPEDINERLAADAKNLTATISTLLLIDPIPGIKAQEDADELVASWVMTQTLLSGY